MLGEEAVDGRLQVDARMKAPSLEASLRQLGEQALVGVEPDTCQLPSKGAANNLYAAGPNAVCHSSAQRAAFVDSARCLQQPRSGLM